MCGEDAFSIYGIEADHGHLLEEVARVENNHIYMDGDKAPSFFIVDQKEIGNKFQNTDGDLDYSIAMSVLGIDDAGEIRELASTLASSVEVVLAICQLPHVENTDDVIAVWEEPPCWRADAIIKSLNPEYGPYYWGNEEV